MATALEIPPRERVPERLPLVISAGEAIPSRPVSMISHGRPSDGVEASTSAMVSLRPMKAVAESFVPAHPLRVLLMGEPDEVPAEEYVAKVRGWFRLMKAESP